MVYSTYLYCVVHFIEFNLTSSPCNNIIRLLYNRDDDGPGINTRDDIKTLIILFEIDFKHSAFIEEKKPFLIL